jgi:hypothetical protein
MGDTTSRPCRGEVIAGISARTVRPAELQQAEKYGPVGGLRGLMHRNTSEQVIRRYLYVHEGQRCRELARSESERVLRQQPFLADARIRVIPLGPDSVRLDVATEDELPLNATLTARSGSFESVHLGNSNIQGLGLSATLMYERGFGYRDGVGVRFTDFQAFGQPWIASVEATRNPRGGSWGAAIGKPFRTNFHPRSWFAGAMGHRTFESFQRTDGLDVAVELNRTQWIGGIAWRLGTRERAWIVGPILESEQLSGNGAPVIVTDTGIVAYTGTDFIQRDYGYRSVHGGALLGARMLTYTPVRGFDALTSTQDLRTGVEAVVYAAPSLLERGNAVNDMLIGSSVYAGVGRTHSLIALQAQAEVSRRQSSGTGQGELVSARGAWYRQSSLRHLTTVSAEFAGGWRTVLPFQLTLSDYSGGMRGFGAARVGGARRFVARAEERWMPPQPTSKADFAVAAFAETGRLWAGDAPFGVTTPSQFSVGLSLLAALPRGSKRVWRADVAVPLTHAGRPRRIEVRASVGDHTRFFWREPVDLQRAREGALVPRVLAAQ